jgi:hypothetical protein
MTKPFSKIFIDNIKSSVYESYKPDYIHPEFKPYADQPFRTQPSGLKFRLMHPDDPCPHGFTKDTSTGMCTMPPSDGKATMFSPSNAQIVQPIPYKPLTSVDNTFAMRSVNPFTGKRNTYYHPKTASTTQKYTPTKTSKTSLIA